MAGVSPMSKVPADRAEEAAKRLADPSLRRAAWRSMFFVDHGFFRYGYLNLHKISDDAFRAAQPAPHHFRRFQRLGVRTVVNLRGGREFGSYPLEIQACIEGGFAYEEVMLKSRDAPKVEAIEAAAELLQRIEFPAVFHCKSGADRTGLMAALYLMLVKGETPTVAKRALSMRYGHFRQSATGILDAFIEKYEQAEAQARAEGRSLDFMDWVRRDYDRKALQREFHSSGWARWITDRVLRRE
ncbi:MAG: tyrosine-protein phosphatase [Neomegalonema sp.]|nr:tyrosine-protein phosphatase [Neomegalonema sp.]